MSPADPRTQLIKSQLTSRAASLTSHQRGPSGEQEGGGGEGNAEWGVSGHRCISALLEQLSEGAHLYTASWTH